MMVAERRDRSGKKKKSSYVRVGVGFADETKLRAKVRGNTGDGQPRDGDGDGIHLPVRNPESGRHKTYLPSEPWVDTHFTEISDIDPDGQPISTRFFNRGAKGSPLNGAASAMVRCTLCGRLTPPQAIEGGACMDHQPERQHAAYGSSPSAAAIRQLQYRNLRADTPRLPDESKSALRREIKQFKRGKWKPA